MFCKYVFFVSTLLLSLLMNFPCFLCIAFVLLSYVCCERFMSFTCVLKNPLTFIFSEILSNANNSQSLLHNASTDRGQFFSLYELSFSVSLKKNNVER